MNHDAEFGAAQEKLREKMLYWASQKGNAAKAIPGLWLYQFQAPSDRTHVIQHPSVCLIGQGSKEIYWGKETLRYDRDHFLCTSLDLPVVAQVQDASPEKPYVGMAFAITPKDIAQLLAEGSLPVPAGSSQQKAMTVGALTLPLIHAFLRYLELLEDPASIPFLAPAIAREILYRLITSEAGSHLRHVALAGSQNAQIHRAVEWMKTHLNQPLTIESLARYCQMSESSLHHHFRKITALSPLQYQKGLRLQEARRLMLVEDLDVTRVAFAVGYESSSQFCREYARQFGESPGRDIKAIKASRGS